LEMTRGDPLLIAMLPIHKERDVRTYYVAAPPDREDFSLYLTLLSLLSSPIRSVVVPISSVEPEWVMDELAVTNVQPLVLTGATTRHTGLLARAGEDSPHRPRTLVVTGAAIGLPPGLKRIETRVFERDLKDLMLMPWQAIGAHVT
jgi:hypothetical protein